MTRADRWLLAAVLALAIALLPLTLGAGTRTRMVEVTTPSGTVLLDLTEPGERTVRGLLGDMVLRVSSEGVRVIESPCPDQRCLNMGPVTGSGGVVVCIPSGVSVSPARGSAEVDHVVR